MNRREAILEGTKRATRLHELLGIRDAVERTSGRVDVFDAAVHQGSILLFRDLKRLLGAYLNENGTPGIIVTTQRPLPIQRFTAAHELGHYFMGHEPTADGDEILDSTRELDIIEVEANAFSAEFLAPKWLFFYHGKRQSWNAEDIVNPVVVYQLALRLGLSYEATCYSLRKHEIVQSHSLRSLLNVAPKMIKRQLLPPSFEPENWYPDVWLLTEKDRNAQIEGQPNDLFVLQLRERSGAGYLWDPASLRSEGFEILTDERKQINRSDAVGASILHEITAGAAPKSAGTIDIAHRRPWQVDQPPLDTLKIDYDVTGKEEGLPRTQRRHLSAIVG